MRSWLLFLSLSFILFSCGQKENEKLIPRKKLVPLLIDMHIADALAMNHTINDQFKDLDSSRIYSSVLKKHGYSKEELLNSMDYYSSRPEKITSIYDEVFSELSLKAEEAKATRNKYHASNTDIIWKSEKPRYIITGKKSQYPPPFEFPLDSAGIYVLNASVKITDEDSSLNPRITAYFFSQDNDVPQHRLYFDKTPLPKSRYTREYILVQKCIDSSFTHMRIIIPEYDNEDTAFYKQTEIYNLRVGRLKNEEK
jgi:hypothetical protein